jgi:hypothetical protein
LSGWSRLSSRRFAVAARSQKKSAPKRTPVSSSETSVSTPAGTFPVLNLSSLQLRCLTQRIVYPGLPTRPLRFEVLDHLRAQSQ